MTNRLKYKTFAALPVYEKATLTPGVNLGFAPRSGDAPLWVRAEDPPAIGVAVRLGRAGSGRVCGYFQKEDYLGLLVKLDNPGEWYVRCYGADAPCHAFGPEFTFVCEA